MAKYSTRRPWNLDVALNLFQTNQPFSFARYHDGDWYAVRPDLKPRTVLEHHTFEPMAEELRQTLLEPHNDPFYYYGVAPGLAPKMKQFWERTWKWIDTKSQVEDWVNSVVFQDAWNPPKFGPILKELRKRRVLMVGPPMLRKLPPEIMPYAEYVEIPIKNCWKDKARISSEVLNHLSRGNIDLVSWSACSLTNILIWEYWEEFGKKIFQIDFGSMWDICVGQKTRGRFKGNWPQLISTNVGMSQ